MEKRTNLTKRQTALFLIALALTCAVSYFRIINYPFVYDDKAVLRDVTAYKLPLNPQEAFTRKYFDTFGERTYRPVVSLSFFIDARLWDMSPAGAHIVSIALHILITWLIFALLNALCGNALAALFGAALFGAHPVHSEAVILASNREELLCALFFFAALYLYVLWRTSRKHTGALVCLFSISFLFSMFSKEMAASLPLSIILVEMSFRERGVSLLSSIRKALPFLVSSSVITLIFLALRYTIFRNSTGEVSWPGGSPWAAFLTMSSAFFLYIRQLVYPIRMCSQYVVPPATTLFSVYGVAATALVALLASGAAFLRRQPLLAFSALFLFLTWLPVSNIIPFGEIMAERYIFIPSLALSVLAAWIFMNVKIAAAAKYVAAAFIVAALSALTIIHAPVWDGDFALWNATASCAPNSSTARLNLGNAYSARGDYAKALAEYKLAGECPEVKEPQKLAYNRGLALLAIGKKGEAERAFYESAEIDASFALPHLNLGALAERRGDSSAAMARYMRAIDISPNNSVAYYVAGRHLFTHARSVSDVNRAALLLSKSAVLNPFDANAHAALAAALIVTGDKQAGAAELQSALALDPANAPAVMLAKQYNVGAPPPAASISASRGISKIPAALSLIVIIAAFASCSAYARRISLEDAQS